MGGNPEESAMDAPLPWAPTARGSSVLHAAPLEGAQSLEVSTDSVGVQDTSLVAEEVEEREAQIEGGTAVWSIDRLSGSPR